jgi:transcription elongation factor/antiterminator RfaH
MNWYAIYTKQGQEIIVSEKLSKLPEIEVINPLIKERKFFRNKLETVQKELFPSYIFARFTVEKYYHTIKYTRGVRRILGDHTGAPFMVDEMIINTIKERMVDGFIKLEPTLLKSGDTVIINKGPFQGFMGVFLSETKPLERVAILLDAMNYQGKVEIDSCLVSKY